MTLTKISLLTLLLFAGTMASAQTADEIIDKHLAALGGKDVINKINSIYTESTLDVMGNQANTTTYLVNGKGYKNEIDFNGNMIVQVVTDKGGWQVNPMMGSATPDTLTAEQHKASKAQIYIGGNLLDYKAKGYKAELGEKEGQNYVLKLTSPENITSTYYIDPSSYMIVKSNTKGAMQGQDINITTTYADYRKTDAGYMMPFKTESDLGQFTLSYVINKVEINKPIDLAIFEMPK